VPVGRGTLGRIMNVVGEPVDEQGPIGALGVVILSRNYSCSVMLVFILCARPRSLSKRLQFAANRVAACDARIAVVRYDNRG
jgi:hypothetical protein